MEEDFLRLDKQVCFKVYSASRAIIRLYKPILDKLGLTYTQYITMLVLWEHTDIDFNALGKILDLKTGTLTPLLKRLEKQGLINRVRSKLDERKVNISLTKEGTNLKAKAKEVPMTFAKKSSMTMDQYHKLMCEFDGLLKQLNIAENE